MERVHHRDRVGEFLAGGGFEPGKAVHRDTSTRSRHACSRSVGHCLKTCLDRPWTMPSSRDGPVLSRIGVRSMTTATYFSPPSGVPPDVFVDADHRDTIEPGRVIDQGPLGFGQDGDVGSV